MCRLFLFQLLESRNRAETRKASELLRIQIRHEILQS